MLKSPFIAKDDRRESWEIAAEGDEEKEAAIRPAWIHFKDYAECFDTLTVFHKPFTYPHSTKKFDFERLGNAWEILATEKRSALAGKMKASQAEARPFLFVDSLEPIRIGVGFASLARWRPIPEKPPDPLDPDNRCKCGEEEEALGEASKLSDYERFCRKYCGIPEEG